MMKIPGGVITLPDLGLISTSAPTISTPGFSGKVVRHMLGTNEL